jgi:hypothetical protein
MRLCSYPGQNILGLLENTPHLSYLTAALLEIILIDTYSVDPQNTRFCRFSKKEKRIPKTFPNGKVLIIDSD